MLIDLSIVLIISLMSFTVLAWCFLLVCGYAWFQLPKSNSEALLKPLLAGLFTLSLLVVIAGFVISDGPDSNDTATPIAQSAAEQTEGRDLFDWLDDKGLEIGLSLGWAAFYFTFATAVFQGQTVGKKVLGMRVVKIDAQPLTLWQSFERYGGYSAGLATGLFGFLQVYWDPNRQSIHDKIAETLVLDLRRKSESSSLSASQN